MVIRFHLVLKMDKEMGEIKIGIPDWLVKVMENKKIDWFWDIKSGDWDWRYKERE